ncbi:MAG: type IV pilin N-terminal domain-containing protein [Candidatus Marinimicrobia bacterium]|nr:type IV pilin N-terminal domain-containing protein [Candidatus Neomarinimicrobiota bacterium]
MKFERKEEAVSPVIGVILMVAITVILAAVIAAFVIPMAQNVETTKSVAATVKQSSANTITVTYQGGQDNADVLSIFVTTPSSTRAEMSTIVGSSHAFPGGTSGQDHVVIVAVFKDGSEQVIYDGYV